MKFLQWTVLLIILINIIILFRLEALEENQEFIQGWMKIKVYRADITDYRLERLENAANLPFTVPK